MERKKETEMKQKQRSLRQKTERKNRAEVNKDHRKK
jgi:hypothetical protein